MLYFYGLAGVLVGFPSAHFEKLERREISFSKLKSCFPLLLLNGSFQMEINKNHFATMPIGRLETNYQV
jgi:hypothetical protein